MLILIRAEVDKKHECPVMIGRFDRSDFASWGGKKKNSFVLFIAIFQPKKKQAEFVIQIFKNHSISAVVQCSDTCCNDDSDCPELHCCVKPLRGKRSLASCGNSGGRCTRYGGLNQGTSTMSIIFTSNDLEGNWKVMVNNHFLMKIGRLPRWSQIHLPLPSWTYLCGDGAERNPPGRSRGLSNTVLRQEMAVISFSIMYILHMREEYSVCSTTLDFFHVLCENNYRLIKLILDQK